MKQVLTGMLCLLSILCLAQENYISDVYLIFDPVIPEGDLPETIEETSFEATLILGFDQYSDVASIIIEMISVEDEEPVYTTTLAFTDLANELESGGLRHKIGRQNELENYEIIIQVMDGDGNLLQKFDKEINQSDL